MIRKILEIIAPYLAGLVEHLPNVLVSRLKKLKRREKYSRQCGDMDFKKKRGCNNELTSLEARKRSLERWLPGTHGFLAGYAHMAPTYSICLVAIHLLKGEFKNDSRYLLTTTNQIRTPPAPVITSIVNIPTYLHTLLYHLTSPSPLPILRCPFFLLSASHLSIHTFILLLLAALPTLTVGTIFSILSAHTNIVSSLNELCSE
jgi:hypothetical protein